MRISRAILVMVFVLIVVTGCTPARDNRVTDTATTETQPTITTEPVETQPARVPDEVIVYVDYRDGNVKATPDEVIVTDEKQTIRWFSCTPGLEIVFERGSKIGTLPIDCEKGQGRCALKIPAGYKGEYKYMVRVIDSANKVVEQDPKVIVEY